jgi:hypothetical protein
MPGRDVTGVEGCYSGLTASSGARRPIKLNMNDFSELAASDP